MKYGALRDHLAAIPRDVREITLSFKQLEEILGFQLPKSAVDYRQWWENPTEPAGRSQAEAWIGAGFKVDSVQLRKPGGWVRFHRV